MATDFAVATLTLKGNTSLEQGEVTLVKTDDPAAASYCAPLYIDQYHVVMYAISGSEKYQIWANADLTDFPLGIKTYSDADYTITVSNVSGSETLNLYDAVANKTIALTNGQTYNFTAAANSTITDRFLINHAAPLVKGICYTYNTLHLTKYDGAKVEVFAKGATTAVVTKTVEGDAEYDVNLNDQTSGMYKVVVTVPGAAEPEEYIIDVKPAVTPANP
jgi:hypothetical protein